MSLNRLIVRDPDDRPADLESLAPHPLALLFPGLNEEELELLAADIAENGQRSPIILYEGKILDGVNRHRACRLRGIAPLVTQFDPSQTTPEQFVISANVLRRHLTPGQRAAIAVDLSEFSPRVDETTQVGRPKSALPEAAKLLGVSRSAAFEARKIKSDRPDIFQDVKSGKLSLGSALEAIKPKVRVTFTHERVEFKNVRSPVTYTEVNLGFTRAKPEPEPEPEPKEAEIIGVTTPNEAEPSKDEPPAPSVESITAQEPDGIDLPPTPSWERQPAQPVVDSESRAQRMWADIEAELDPMPRIDQLSVASYIATSIFTKFPELRGGK
jgi:hypothetical protein